MFADEMFIRIPISAVMDRRLSRSTLLLYGVLIDAADKFMQVINLTTAEMAARCKTSEKTIRRAEAQLVECGYIEIFRTGRASQISVLHYLQPLQGSAIEAHRKKVLEERSKGA